MTDSGRKPSKWRNAMAGKRRTPLPRSPARKRTPRSKPVVRPKGEAERLAVRRRDAMQYRLAGASYRAIAEKLTEERAQAYADEHGVSFERAMKKFPHVSKRTAWDDVTAEWEELRRETEVQRADGMALENARLDQVFSKALSLFSKGDVPAGRLALAAMARRAQLNGLDAPTKIAPRPAAILLSIPSCYLSPHTPREPKTLLKFHFRPS